VQTGSLGAESLGTMQELWPHRPLVLSGHSRLIETAGNLGIAVRDEAAFVSRAESAVATDGNVDLLGFSERKTVPVMK
jgi:hypothetical protein